MTTIFSRNNLEVIDQDLRPPKIPQAQGGKALSDECSLLRPQEGPPSHSTLYRILVVDDDPLVRFAHQQLLEQLHCHVTLADSGQEALRHLNDQPLFDAVLIDMDLGDSFGTDIAQQVRQGDTAMKDVPLILITSQALKDLAPGYIDLYLQKPVALELLRAALVLVLKQ